MVTVVGLGFVGLTTALGFAEYGHKVYGIEADELRREIICAGKVPFFEPGLDCALAKHLGKNFILTTDWEAAIADSSCVYYCVGTPYSSNGSADMTYLYGALEQTLQAVPDHNFRVLVIKSTVPPSSTENYVIPFLKGKGAKVPEQFGIANNPEFLREGHCWEDFIHADRIVLGVSDSRSEELLRMLYANGSAPVCCVSPTTAEFIKYLSNPSLACLISYANEMSIMADAIGGIDVADAFRILHMDKRWQSGSIRSYFYPGCGYGGYCLPKDTHALYAMSKHNGYEGKILKNVIDLNGNMPEITAKRILRKAGGNIETCIGILGLSFNPGSDDIRDTPSAKVIQALNQLGYQNIVVYDPVAMEEFQLHYKLKFSCASSYDELLERVDIAAIITAWPEFGDIKERTSKPIVDCRYML